MRYLFLGLLFWLGAWSVMVLAAPPEIATYLPDTTGTQRGWGINYNGSDCSAKWDGAYVGDTVPDPTRWDHDFVLSRLRNRGYIVSRKGFA